MLYYQKHGQCLKLGGLAPKGSQRVHFLLEKAVEGLFEGAKKHIFTLMYFCLGRKPLLEDQGGGTHAGWLPGRVCLKSGSSCSRAELRERKPIFQLLPGSSLGSTSTPTHDMQKLFRGSRWFHSGQFLNTGEKVIEPADQLGANSNASCATATKTKRKKLKGKRAVVRWLKFFRWKKKKEYERMTAEEKLLYKLRKARKKEERLSEALQKIEPKDPSKTTHDPEILTPEEHFYFWKMGLKCKNYVPIGRRGIYQGVILNMHLHWKKHQTLQVIVKTFSQEEVKEIAVELARLSGGIVLGIHEENTIIMYRGKNYSQPPTEIMSPRITLSRKKALDKSKYRDGLRAVKKYIPRLEQELELLQAQANRRGGDETGVLGASDSVQDLGPHLDSADWPRETATDTDEDDLGISSGSEALSDIFETESSGGDSEREEHPLYLHEFDKLPVESDEEPESFEEQLEQISSSRKDAESPSLDEVDKLVLRAASLLKKKRR